MFQFRQNEDLKRGSSPSTRLEKPTALLCHGLAALIDVQLSDGSYLAEGKTVTGFANVEEDYLDTAVGQKVMPYRIEDEPASAAPTTSRAVCSKPSPFATGA